MNDMMINNVLIAEDDPISRKVLFHALSLAGYPVVEAQNGTEAWEILNSTESPALAILDWIMPGLDGPDLCRAVRQRKTAKSPYLILLTSKGKRQDIVAGLEAGADDYMIKPFDGEELHARVRVGFRVLALQEGLETRVHELEQALSQITHLRGLLPICCYCKRIRDDQNYWKQVEEYLSENSDIRFSHGICPNCYQSELVPQLASLRAPKR